MDFDDVVRLAFREGCELDWSTVLRRDSFQRASLRFPQGKRSQLEARSRAATLHPFELREELEGRSNRASAPVRSADENARAQNSRAILSALGEELVAAAEKTLSAEQLALADRFASATADEQLELLGKLYAWHQDERVLTEKKDEETVADGNPEWYSDLRTQTLGRVLPARYRDESSEDHPNCIGRAQQLVAFFRRAGVETAVGVLVEDHDIQFRLQLLQLGRALMNSTRKNRLQGVRELNRVFRANERALNHTRSTPSRIHLVVHARLNDGLWWQIDPNFNILTNIFRSTAMDRKVELLRRYRDVQPGVVCTFDFEDQTAAQIRHYLIADVVPRLERVSKLIDLVTRRPRPALDSVLTEIAGLDYVLSIISIIKVPDTYREVLVQGFKGHVSDEALLKVMNAKTFQVRKFPDSVFTLRSQLEVYDQVMSAENLSVKRRFVENGSIPEIDPPTATWLLLDLMSHNRLSRINSLDERVNVQERLDIAFRCVQELLGDYIEATYKYASSIRQCTSGRRIVPHTAVELGDPEFLIAVATVQHLGVLSGATESVEDALSQVSADQYRILAAATKELRGNGEVSSFESYARQVLVRISPKLVSAKSAIEVLNRPKGQRRTHVRLVSEMESARADKRHWFSNWYDSVGG